MSTTAFQTKALKYIALHHTQFQRQIITMNNNFNNGDFKAVGSGAGELLKDIVGSDSIIFNLKDASDDLQQIADGFWEKGGLSDPTTVVQCFDEDQAQAAMSLISSVLD